MTHRRLNSENVCTSCSSSCVSVLYSEAGVKFSLTSRVWARLATSALNFARSSAFLNRGRRGLYGFCALSPTVYTIRSSTTPEYMSRLTRCIFSLPSLRWPFAGGGGLRCGSLARWPHLPPSINGGPGDCRTRQKVKSCPCYRAGFNACMSSVFFVRRGINICSITLSLWSFISSSASRICSSRPSMHRRHEPLYWAYVRLAFAKSLVLIMVCVPAGVRIRTV